MRKIVSVLFPIHPPHRVTFLIPGVHMLSVLVPMLVSFLFESLQPDKGISSISWRLHQISLQKLMQIGPSYQTHFRTIMQSSTDLRNRIESAIKSQQSAGTNVHDNKKASDMSKVTDAPTKPSIQLKTNFGNFNG